MANALPESRFVRDDAGVITGRQIRMARSMLRLTARQVADDAQVSPTSVSRAEAVDGVPGMHTHTLARIQQTLERLGVEFGRDGSTVRLRRQS